jgi:hypothetical protein
MYSLRSKANQWCKNNWNHEYRCKHEIAIVYLFETALRPATYLSSTNNKSSIRHHTTKVNVVITHYIYIHGIVTHSMVQGPQEKLLDLHLVKDFQWNQKVLYHINKIPRIVPMLKQINLGHILPLYLFRIYSCPAESRTYS